MTHGHGCGGQVVRHNRLIYRQLWGAGGPMLLESASSCAGDRHDVVRDAWADPADVHVVGVANLGCPALGGEADGVH